MENQKLDTVEASPLQKLVMWTEREADGKDEAPDCELLVIVDMAGDYSDPFVCHVNHAGDLMDRHGEDIGWCWGDVCRWAKLSDLMPDT
jgi:hypothetical protein